VKTINLSELASQVEANEGFGPFNTVNKAQKARLWLVGYFITLYTILIFAFFFSSTVANAADALAGNAAASPPSGMTTVAKAHQPATGGLYLATKEKGKVLSSAALKTIVHLEITGPIVRARITQYFKNPTKYWLEGIYTFPLPETSAVDALTMTIGERTIKGVIKLRALARKIYERAASEGKRASLMDQQRANIFTTQVANIGPGEEIAITIEYQQVLSLKDGQFDLRFPMVIRPRYIPGATIIASGSKNAGWIMGTDQVPDAELITPPIADPRKGPINPVILSITLNSGFPIEKLVSNSHRINVVEERDGSVRVSLNETPADSDFVLSWQPVASSTPLAGVFSERVGDYDYHLILVMPPKELSDAQARQALPREVIYILDKSGSMAGDAMDQAKAALISALKRGNPKDRFNVIAFESKAHPLWSRARAATEANIAEAIGFVKALEADGGTEMSGALKLALDGRTDKSTIRQVVFITDGAVGNEDALMNQIKANLGSTKLFTVGIGAAPNSYFMTEAAEQGKGSYVYISYDGDLKSSMMALFQKLENPALTDIDDVWSGGLTPVTFPNVLPDLYVGDPLIFVARTKAGASKTITLSGSIGSKSWSTKITLVTPKTGQSSKKGLHKIWARDNITQLERHSRRLTNGESLEAQITAVALEHQLVSRYTSLVAVDDEVARPDGEELVESDIATNLPKDMDPSFVLGGLQTQEAALQRSRQASSSKMARPAQGFAGGIPSSKRSYMASPTDTAVYSAPPLVKPAPGTKAAPLRIDRSVLPTGKQVMLPAGALGWKALVFFGGILMLLALLVTLVLHRRGAVLWPIKSRQGQAL
jgi:Ca-activated chloride channel family protein